MNILRNFFLFSVGITTVLACAGTTSKNTTHEIPKEHQWSEREMRILQTLSLNDFLPKNDTSNRVADSIPAAKLGKKLFFDTRLSKNGTIACATCHSPEQYFTDGKAQASGLAKTTRNTPTIVGASNNTWFFHDGRVDSLWSQALHPIENDKEHGSNRSEVAHLIFNDKQLRSDYEAIFGPMPDISDITRFPKSAGPVKDTKALDAWESMSSSDQKTIVDIYVNVGKTIAAYESKLQPSPSRFDKYVKALSQNDKDQAIALLNADETNGLRLFLDKGKCFICHNGPLFSDQGFHNIGAPPLNTNRYDYGRNKGVRKVKRSGFNCRSEYNDSKDKSCNELKFMVIHEEETMAAFKTPSLRNVSKTAPYMHAGQYNTLKDVIKHYNDPPSTKVGMSNLLDIDLTDKEMQQLESFLLTLDSPIEADPTWLSAN